MTLLSDKDAEEVRKLFKDLERDVHLTVYTRKLECPACEDTEAILKELVGLSDRLKVTFLNSETDRDKAERDGVEMTPAVIVSDGTHSRVKFYGTPSGYEFSSLLTAIVDSGGAGEPLSDDSVEFLDSELDRDLRLRVFVTPTCPHCPASAVLASRMARHSPRVEAEIIESNEFPELSKEFRVQGVPRMVIDRQFYAEGALPESMVVQALRQGLREDPSGEKNLMDYLQTG